MEIMARFVGVQVIVENIPNPLTARHEPVQRATKIAGFSINMVPAWNPWKDDAGDQLRNKRNLRASSKSHVI